jgi:phage terminase large subunit-like protein
MKRPDSSPLCVPRWATARNFDRPTLAPALAEIARRLGRPLMPWQLQVAEVGLELAEDGTPAYREVAFTVPRQSGKTTLILAWEIHRAVAWAQILGPQLIVYSAQTGQDARKKLIADQYPILEPRKKLLGITDMLKGMGGETVIWANGSRLELMANTVESGHGRSVDFAVKDELFADHDMRRDQALIPAMATRPYGQMLTASTAGDAESTALNAMVEKGRNVVRNGRDRSLAYFEWSANEDDDPADPEVWARCMPALGHTIGLETIQHAYDTMVVDEFKRAFLNIQSSASVQLIPKQVWDAVCDKDIACTAEFFALDVNPERSKAAVVAAGAGVIELVDYRQGLDWLVSRAVELSRKYRRKFAVDANGPAGSFIEDLRKAEVDLVEMKPQDVVRATGNFYDAVVDRHVKIRRHMALDEAVAGAAKRAVGDAWVWGRKSSKTDISPLVAATVALYAANERRSAPLAAWS